MVSDEEFRTLRGRVERLEHVVAGVDRDVAAVQAQRRADLDLLMALRGTQLEQGEQIASLRGEVADLRGETQAGFAAIMTVLQRLENNGEG